MSNSVSDINSNLDLGLDVLEVILDYPDNLFDEMKETFLLTTSSSFKDKEFRKSILKSIELYGEEEVYQTTQSIKQFIEGIKNGTECTEYSESKKDFLIQLFSMANEEILQILDNPYTTVDIYIETCSPNAEIPEYACDGDAGVDVVAIEDLVLLPGFTMIAKTGLKVAIPRGWELQVRPRSGKSLKTKMRIANSPGTIDSGYRDEIGIIVENIGDTTITINKGDKIAQLVANEVPKIRFLKVENVKSIGIDREGGFGHSGE